MKLNKKLILICSIFIFILLFVNISYTDTRQFLIIMCIALILAIIISLLINFMVEIVKKILS